MAAYFNIFLIVMALLALAVYIALHYFEAGYGYLFNRKYGFPIPNRIGWVLMECPVFIAMTVLWLLSDRTWEAAPLALLILFQGHYLQRAFIFPLLIRGNSKMPAGIVGMGMLFNTLNHSDYIIRHLRKPGDTRHYIPRGGMFRYVSSANYFGELTEWVGFAIASWSWAGAVFAWWTFANLAPRAASLYKRYEKEFGQEFTSLHRKRIIPFIY